MRWLDRLTGLSRIAVPYLLWMLALPTAVAMGLAGYGLLAGRDLLWFVPPDGQLVDPADGEVNFVVFLLSFLVTLVAPWTTWARLLKVVPLSVRSINALLVLTPFLTWMLLMTAGCVAHGLLRGAPLALRVDLVIGLGGIGALAHAGLLRFQGSPGMFWIFPVASVPLRHMLEAGLADSSRVIFAAAGAVAAIAATGINHATLTQSTSSSAPYRRPQTPFGPAAGPR